MAGWGAFTNDCRKVSIIILFAGTENYLYYNNIGDEPLMVRFNGSIVGDIGEMVEGALIEDRENGLIIWEDPDYKSRFEK